MNRKDAFERIYDFIHNNSSYYNSIRDDLKEFEKQIKRWKYFEDIALNGRDSDDARNCVPCRNCEEDFIEIDLMSDREISQKLRR